MNLPILLNYTENNENKLFIENLINGIRNGEKSTKWIWRNIFGTKLKWYNDVEE